MVGQSPTKAAREAVAAAVWGTLENAAAAGLLSRYLTIPAGALLYVWMLWAEPVLRPLLLLYLPYIWSPLGRRHVSDWSPCLARQAWLWPGLQSYFPARLVRTTPLDPQRRYLLVTHPHGVASNGIFAAFGTGALGQKKLFPGLEFRTGRELCLLLGIVDANRATLLRVLGPPGRALVLTVGGASEALLSQEGCYDLVLRRRRGFVRVALHSGAALVLVLVFGENDQFHRVHVEPGSKLDRLQRAFKRGLGFTLPLAYGRGILGLRYGPLPERVLLTVVVGAPLPAHRFEGSLESREGQEAVEQLHAAYVEALLQLWERHKEELAPNRRQELRLVE